MNYKESAIVLVFNDQGELALQLRSATDKKYPLHWDFSAGGGIDKDEDHTVAAVRETMEEIGVKVAVEFIAEELYEDDKGQDRLFIYRAKHNGPFIPDPVEVQEVRFANLETIKHMLESDVPFHPEFPYLWEKGIVRQAAE